jgi:hypothetical protein
MRTPPPGRDFLPPLTATTPFDSWFGRL